VCTKVSTVKRMYTEVHNLSTVCEKMGAQFIGKSSDFYQFEPFVVNGKIFDLKTNQFQSLSRMKKKLRLEERMIYTNKAIHE